MIKLSHITIYRYSINKETSTYYKDNKEITNEEYYLGLGNKIFYDRRETYYYDDGFETRRTVLTEDNNHDN